ncbi:MAG TPA: CBS domain-containing protein [Archaeoglobus profundus]|nr:CBS domain-containing protein [Archaeoglobus profundus]
MISKRLVFISIGVGILSGSGAFIFYILTNVLTELLLGLSGFHPPKAGGEVGLELDIPTFDIPLWLIPAIGGLISGLIVYTLAPEAEGHGTDAVIRAFHRFRGVINARIPIIKMIASAITIGSGGSAGREGPIAQIGAGFGSLVATLLKLSDSERRMLLIAGMAGGIGSIFKSPLGGAIYAVEVLYKKDYEVEAIIPAFISSITAYIIFVSLIGSKEHIFIVPEVKIYSLLEIPLYLLLGILSAVVAIIYIKIFYTIHNIFKKLKISNYLKPAIGGLITGIIGTFIPQALGMGYGYVQEVIDGKIMLDIIILAIFGKILATAFTVGSGGSGGVFGPTVVIGGFVGGLVGYIFHQLFPDIVVQPTGYILVGIASLIAGACKTPIAAVLMTVEMTGGYELLPVLMLSATTSYILTRDESLFIEQVSTRAESPAHRGEFLVDILENIKVEQVMTRDVITVSPKDTTAKVMELIKKTGYMGYPVIENGKLVGIITFNDVERVGVSNKIKVEDAMTKNVIVTYPDENLKVVLEKMVKYKIGRLPVVAREDKTKLLGIISKRDIIREYIKEKLKV